MAVMFVGGGAVENDGLPDKVSLQRHILKTPWEICEIDWALKLILCKNKIGEAPFAVKDTSLGRARL